MLEGLEAGDVDTGQGTNPRGQCGAGEAGARAHPRRGCSDDTPGAQSGGAPGAEAGKWGEMDNFEVSQNDEFGLQSGYGGKRKSF